MGKYALVKAYVHELFVDRRYQRGLIKAQVRRLVEGWDWEKYHPITVSHRADGRLAVIAGQQRTTAAQELGIEWLPAVLITHTSLQEEAKSYIGSGETANIGAGDRFRARLVANEAKAMDIWNVVNAEGFTFACLRQDEGGKNDPFALRAVWATENIYDSSPNYLRRVLSIIREAWGGGDAIPDMTSSSMLKGIYLAIRYLERYEISDEDIIKAWGRTSVKDTLDEGASRYRSMTAGRSMDVGVASVLVDAYNFRRRLDSQVPMFTRAVSRSLSSKNAAKTTRQKVGEEAYRAVRAANAAGEARGKGGRFQKREKAG